MSFRSDAGISALHEYPQCQPLDDSRRRDMQVEMVTVWHVFRDHRALFAHEINVTGADGSGWLVASTLP